MTEKETKRNYPKTRKPRTKPVSLKERELTDLIRRNEADLLVLNAKKEALECGLTALKTALKEVHKFKEKYPDLK